MRIGRKKLQILCYLLQAEGHPIPSRRIGYDWVYDDITRDCREIVEEGLGQEYTDSNRIGVSNSCKRLIADGLVEIREPIQTGHWGTPLNYYKLTEKGRAEALQRCVQ